MDIRPIMRGNTLYVILDGEIDEHNAAVARRQADELIDAYAYAERAVFDLNRVSFMDSTGIGFLIGRYKNAESNEILEFGDPIVGFAYVPKSSIVYISTGDVKEG